MGLLLGWNKSSQHFSIDSVGTYETPPIGNETNDIFWKVERSGIYVVKYKYLNTVFEFHLKNATKFSSNPISWFPEWLFYQWTFIQRKTGRNVTTRLVNIKITFTCLLQLPHHFWDKQSLTFLKTHRILLRKNFCFAMTHRIAQFHLLNSSLSIPPSWHNRARVCELFLSLWRKKGVVWWNSWWI